MILKVSDPLNRGNIGETYLYIRLVLINLVRILLQYYNNLPDHFRKGMEKRSSRLKGFSLWDKEKQCFNR